MPHSRSGRGRRRGHGRGVSPIIAEILLVASTCVCAAVLYVLVSGYISGSGTKPPANIGFSNSIPSSVGCSSAVSYYELVSVDSASTGITTDDLSLSITSVVGGTHLAATASEASTNNCPGSGVSSGWWVLLDHPDGTLLACLSSNDSGAWVGVSGGGCTDAPPASSIAISSGDTLVVYVVGTNPAGTYNLNAGGVGDFAVSGTVQL